MTTALWSDEEINHICKGPVNTDGVKIIIIFTK